MWGSGSGHVQVARELKPALPSNERVRCHRALPRQRRHGRADKRRHARAGTEALKELEPGPCCHSATREPSARAWDSPRDPGRTWWAALEARFGREAGGTTRAPRPRPPDRTCTPETADAPQCPGRGQQCLERGGSGGGASGVSGAAPGAAATQRGHPLCLLKESRWPPVRGLQ